MVRGIAMGSICLLVFLSGVAAQNPPPAPVWTQPAPGQPTPVWVLPAAPTTPTVTTQQVTLAPWQMQLVLKHFTDNLPERLDENQCKILAQMYFDQLLDFRLSMKDRLIDCINRSTVNPDGG